MITNSMNSLTTRMYDNFQYYTNDIHWDAQKKWTRHSFSLFFFGFCCFFFTFLICCFSYFTSCFYFCVWSWYLSKKTCYAE
jgi:hypothetical protein